MNPFLKILVLFLMAGPVAVEGAANVDNGAKQPFKAKGPLSVLPSKPGPHIEKIKKMKADSWLVLGSPAPDPKWGKARGRAWAPEMPFVPELRAAFITGEGIHGYVKPNGHYMDDLFAYDINGHRWICVYPGAHCKNLKLKLDEEGFEVNERGERVPVAYLGHAYDHVTYLPKIHKLMIITSDHPFWSRRIPQRWKWLDQKYPKVKKRSYGHAGPIIKNRRHPIFYNLAEGRWERVRAPGKALWTKGFIGVLEYVPSVDKVFFEYYGTAYYYDYHKNTWVGAGGERQSIAYDANGCYDHKRDRVYVIRHGFWFFDVKERKWGTIKAEGQPEKLGQTSGRAMNYDSVGDAMIWFKSGGAGILIYDPAKGAWKKAAPPPKINWKHRGVNGFYDPEANIHFFHMAGDSQDNGIMICYRYKNKA